MFAYFPADKHWGRFFTVAGKPELAQDPRFADQPSRSKNIDALYEIVTEIMAQRTSADWLEALEEADVPVMPMNSPEDLLTALTLKRSGCFPKLITPRKASLGISRCRSRSRRRRGYYRHPENLGESTREALSGVGFSDDEIDALIAPARRFPEPARYYIFATHYVRKFRNLV